MDYVRWLIEHPDNGQDFPYYFGNYILDSLNGNT